MSQKYVLPLVLARHTNVALKYETVYDADLDKRYYLGSIVTLHMVDAISAGRANDK